MSTAHRRVHTHENGVSGLDHGVGDGGRSASASDVSEDSDEFVADQEEPESKTGTLGYLGRFIGCLMCGFIFGFVVEKGRVFEPINIRGQMIFKRLLYGKISVAAIAAGMFGLSLMAMLPGSNRKFHRVCIEFYSRIANRGIIACTLGGCITGIGMALAGSCPMLVYVQLGAQVPNAVYTFLGAVFGALVFGLLRSALNTLTRPFFTTSSNPWAKSSYFITALPLVAMFAMLVFAFELLIPWDVEVKKQKASLDYLERRAWTPMMCGLLIGLLQIPLVLGSETCLQDSTSHSTLVSQIFIGPLKRLSPYLSYYRGGYRNWSQLLFVCGVVAGAYMSGHLSSSLASVKGVPTSLAFIGGGLMTFGAELAGGSTYMHGQTGMGLLSILSVITMTCLAVSAMVTAQILRLADVITPKITV